MRCTLLTSTVVLTVLALSATATEQLTTKEYLEEANKLLLRGKFHEAIKSYDTAIEKDPQNYLSYFKRATTLLSVSKHSSAIRDFTRAIELKPDFEQAYYQRARAYLKEGSYDSAEEDVVKIVGGNASLKTKSKELKDKIVLAREMNAVSARALKEKKYEECTKAADQVIRISPLYTSTLKTRATCRVAEGDIEGACADLGKLVRIHSGDLDTQNLLADLHFLALNEPSRGLNHVRACLKSDPDNKKCKATFTRLRGLERKLEKLEQDKAKGKWNTCNRVVAPVSGKGGLLEEVDGMYAELILSAEIPATVASKLANYLAGVACEGYTNTKNWNTALGHCGRLLEADPENSDALGHQFDAQFESDQLDPAQITLSKLEQLMAGGGIDQQRMHERRVKLEQKKRQAARKDYYKVLDVSRDASQSEIKKAYRKLAHQWHPDRYRGDLPKEEVEMKMAEINQAHEVLANEEVRARYDQGHDPNDPTGGAGGGPGGFGGFGGSQFMFQQGEGRPMFFQQGSGSGKPFSFQFGGPGGPGGFPF
ncbi:hypothetical protein GGI13_002019 [Coemansia sp. RSA 455]|nr:hypothetical protein GGI14_001445 [Coemansia sp. S680]KAJ2031234.1 hypothetical protein H4S03_006716 [Coemansia sp. S3946]KAJ2047701.1 hypothetical protein H4S04_004278 [Coemansia sp. S16]KAJ2116070.1 hypothetical protein IW146_001802 [Coemansia sp. RSA 922]KAJ2254683.1 hypothetical protein GGI13_002019 [Coemansia sp. RSA 455]